MAVFLASSSIVRCEDTIIGAGEEDFFSTTAATGVSNAAITSTISFEKKPKNPPLRKRRECRIMASRPKSFLTCASASCILVAVNIFTFILHLHHP